MNAHRALLAGGLALVAACGQAPSKPAPGLPPALHRPAPITFLRLPLKGGTATAYDGQTLAPLAWSAERVPALRTVVGADLDQDFLYALDEARTLVVLDLRTRRARPLLRGVRQAALGPDGALFVVDTAGVVTLRAGRRVVRLDDRLPAGAGHLVGAAGGRLLALPAERAPGLTVLSAAQPAEKVPLPAGRADATPFGDAIAVAADSEVVLYLPGEARPPRRLEVDGHARDVLFSPSGHRFYVARDEDALLAFDRFGAGELGDVPLPGPAAGLREDVFGQRLLVRPARGDSVWVVDPGSRRVVAVVASRWASDLPAVSPPGTLLVRRGGDVVGLDLASPRLAERGRVKGGAQDLWVALAWTPAAPAPAPEAADAADEDAGAPVSRPPAGAGADSAAAPAAPQLFLQVSSSRNPDWARDLASRLVATGIEARVLEPGADSTYRVAVGPFASREAADSASRRLGMPSFVITVTAPAAP